MTIRNNRFLMVVILGAILVPVSQCWPQANSNNKEMAKIFEADQKDRQGGMNITQEQWKQIDARDLQRREQVRKLLGAGELVTGEDFEHAAFVFQHGTQPSDYLMAHILAVSAIARGDARARWISAATLDRYLHSIKQPQVFGTQYTWKDTPKGRVSTQEPYDPKFMSDALRHEFCVSTLREQEGNVKAISDHKGLTHLDGCR